MIETPVRSDGKAGFLPAVGRFLRRVFTRRRPPLTVLDLLEPEMEPARRPENPQARQAPEVREPVAV